MHTCNAVRRRRRIVGEAPIAHFAIMLQQPAPAPTDTRTVTLWFGSPRRACVAAIRLMVLVPGAEFRLPITDGDGAEGPIAVVVGTIPAAEVEHAGRLLDVLSVPVAWDQQPAA